jgi:thiol-disulfide isomerase/thioredoxin
MEITKKNFLVTIAVFFLLIFGSFIPTDIKAQEKVTLHLFWSYGCPHCQKEKIFLAKLVEKYPQLEIKDYEVSSSRTNAALLKKAGDSLGANVSGVPFTVIGQEYFIGYLNDETTGKKIEAGVNCALENDCQDVVGSLFSKSEEDDQDKIKGAADIIEVPIFGKLDTKKLSLPVLTFVIALLDGFNPCAMWVLLFLISLLLGMKDKKRMWILGSVFIAASGFVYFLFLSAWLNLFLFLGWVTWIRILVGLVALGAGGYYLWDYITNKSGACKVMGSKKKQKVFDKLKKVTQKKQLGLAVLGMIILAFAVNLVELVCSAGLPAVYTQVLSLANLPTWQYYLYLIFYILIFMLDDLVVFFVAMTTLKMTGLSVRYSRISHLVGGILISIIGFLLIFKPEVLMFG